jgi:predicted deacetylase
MSLEAARARPALLVSIHDVSPLTLESSCRAVELAVSSGVPRSAITLLVIPRHEDRVALDESPATCDWLHSLVDAGACLCVHGLTHRMTGRVRNPIEWFWARGFARGQGEFFLCESGECERRLEDARAVFRRAGFEAHALGFVPPAWLLSAQALSIVERSAFAFHERLAGIVSGGRVRARRLIGFASLSAVEACLSAGLAHLQSRRRPADTRFAIHPVDVERASSVRAIEASLRRLLDALEPLSYIEFLGRDA